MRWGDISCGVKKKPLAEARGSGLESRQGGVREDGETGTPSRQGGSPDGVFQVAPFSRLMFSSRAPGGAALDENNYACAVIGWLFPEIQVVRDCWRSTCADAKKAADHVICGHFSFLHAARERCGLPVADRAVIDVEAAFAVVAQAADAAVCAQVFARLADVAVKIEIDGVAADVL